MPNQLKVIYQNGSEHSLPDTKRNLTTLLTQNRLKPSDKQARIILVDEVDKELKVFAQPFAVTQREVANKTIAEKEARIKELEAQLAKTSKKGVKSDE